MRDLEDLPLTPDVVESVEDPKVKKLTTGAHRVMDLIKGNGVDA